MARGGGGGGGWEESRSTLIVRNVVTMAVQHSAYVVHRSAAQVAWRFSRRPEAWNRL